MRKWRHSTWTYRRHALTHYGQSVVAAVPLAIGLISLSIVAAAVLLLVGEILLLVTLPRLTGFRQCVDASIERSACVRAATLRAGLLSRMSETHRIELDHLEQLAARLRDASDVDRVRSETADEWLGVDALLAVYVRLAIAHRESAEAFPPSGDVYLDAKIAELDDARTRDGAESRAWVSRRLAILRDRRETWRRARDERAVLAHELATITDIFHWMYEQSALGRCVDAQAEVVAALASCAKNGPALRELSALKSTGNVDAEVLRLGRRAMTYVAPPPPPPAPLQHDVGTTAA